MDELQANLREQTIQNHRLTSEVGELGIRISHHLEDLTKARAERDQFQADYKNASERLAALGEELKDVRTKYEAIKLSILAPPQVVDHKRKRDADERDLRLPAPAFHVNEQLMESQGYQGSPHHNPSPQNRHAHWSSTNNTFSQIANPRYENGLNNPQRPSIVSNLSANTNSTCPSAETSPLPSPSFQAELQATGVHSTPWSQPAIYSLQPRPVSPRSTTPTMLDSQRTPDPRKRIKLDANQTTPPAHFATPTRGIPTLNDKNSTSTTTTTTHITQISSTTTNSPKRPTNTPSMLTPSRAIPLPSTPQGCRIPSEVRKRTISLRARPLRSSSRDRKGPQPDEREAGEVFEDDPVEARPGYNSSSSESP